MRIICSNVEETAALAKKIAAVIEGKVATLALTGDLGAGKTTFTKALAKALGVKQVVNSPTFTIMKPYRMADGRTLYHLDAYRLEGVDQDLGFEDCFDDGIAVVEWAGFLQDQLPADAITIHISRLSDTVRAFDVEGVEV